MTNDFEQGKDKDENVSEFLRELGFTPLSDSKWTHKDFGFLFSFEGITKRTFVLRLANIFESKGYENCQRNLRLLMGVKS